ncbi:hypothetical protein L1987_79334 [Smallanthus sonchifolius]|uniref:Uncharacterized protein n=1 Tax=Smallanthus sonchifolius TaxID=185202 RepID=A0ACB8ZE76_9ASTR|nr:hypothetical protein L1987_79334 [Smallanthus sonchifolius]
MRSPSETYHLDHQLTIMAGNSSLMPEKEYVMMLESKMRMVEKLGIKEYVQVEEDAKTWDEVQKKISRLKKNLEKASSLRMVIEPVSDSRKILEQTSDLKKNLEATSNSLEKFSKLLKEDDSTYL